MTEQPSDREHDDDGDGAGVEQPIGKVVYQIDAESVI